MGLGVDSLISLRDNFDCLHVRKSRFVGPRGAQRIVDVRHLYDARGERDGLAAELIRVAGAIPFFVVAQRDFGAHLKAWRRVQDPPAVGSMLIHLGALIGIQAAAFL